MKASLTLMTFPQVVCESLPQSFKEVNSVELFMKQLKTFKSFKISFYLNSTNIQHLYFKIFFFLLERQLTNKA